MSDDRAVLRKKMQGELVDLKSSALAELERRGYEVRGKTTTQISFCPYSPGRGERSAVAALCSHFTR